MKKLLVTLCFAAGSLSLAACTSDNQGTFDSSASYATDRTAGDVEAPAMPAKPERVFKTYQSK